MGTLTGARTGMVSSGNPEASLSVRASDNGYAFVIDDAPAVEVDELTGGLRALTTPSGKALLKEPVLFNVTRASTDNDRGGAQMLMDFVLPPAGVNLVGMIVGTDLFSHEYHWGQNGLDASAPPKQVCRGVTVDDSDLKEGKVSYAEAACAGEMVKAADGKGLFDVSSTYRVHRNGDVKVTCKVKAKNVKKGLTSLPRVGLTLALDPSLFNISYLGRGSGDTTGENYPDRQSAAFMGTHSGTPASMHVPYIVPSENGARTDCSWACFADVAGEGLIIRAGPGRAGASFSFSAGLHTQAELHEAEHTYDLPIRKQGVDPVYVNVDHRIMGVGGDCSWLPCVYPEYLVEPGDEYEFELWLCPVGKGQSSEAQGRRPLGV